MRWRYPKPSHIHLPLPIKAEPFALAHQSWAICSCPSKLSHLPLPTKAESLVLAINAKSNAFALRSWETFPGHQDWIICHYPLSWATFPFHEGCTNCHRSLVEQPVPGHGSWTNCHCSLSAELLSCFSESIQLPMPIQPSYFLLLFSDQSSVRAIWVELHSLSFQRSTIDQVNSRSDMSHQ